MDDTWYRLISKRINDETTLLNKYRGDYIRNDSIDGYVNAHSTSLFTNIVKQFFTNKFLLELNGLKETTYFICSDCGKRVGTGGDKFQRCHTLSRGKILKEALINLNFGKGEYNISTYDVIKEFLLLHAKYPLKIKCVECHKEETRINVEE